MKKAPKPAISTPPAPEERPASAVLMALIGEQFQKHNEAVGRIVQLGAQEAGLKLEEGWKLALDKGVWLRVST